MSTLSKISLEKLKSYIGQIFDRDKVIDEELLDTIAKISDENNCEIGIVIDRSGKILDISTGSNNRVEYSVESNYNGLSHTRIIHTHPRASAKLSSIDISGLRNNRLDMMVAISTHDGKPYEAQVGFFNGEVILSDILDARFLNKYGLNEKVIEYERDYLRSHREDLDGKTRAVLVAVKLKNDKYYDDMAELSSLADTCGIEVVDKISQARASIDPKYYIGSGKISEIRESIQLNNADLVIFDNELSGTKTYSLEQALGVRVIDRSRLILDIFAQRARSSEGKLQVQLAQLKYSLPRLSALSNSAGRFGSGGAGMRGPGETKLELSRRVVERNIQNVEKSLKNLERRRASARSTRGHDTPVIAIVGYTNSGKSTLLNRLTKANVYAKDELFATLDTTARALYLDGVGRVVIVDTVGFVSRLPHEFIEAFASTLDETKYADLLLHVIDASDPQRESHIRVVEELLSSLGVKSKIIRVYNKCDLIDSKTVGGLRISAITGEGLDDLRAEIVKNLKNR